MRARHRIFVAVILLCAPTASSAEPKPADSAVFRMVFDAIDGREQVDANFRSRLAVTIRAFWDDYSSSISRNSPAIEEWLKTELNTTDTNRIGRATSTPEYALQQLATQADECVADATLLTKSVGKKAIVEMYAWLRMAGCYGNPMGTEVHLKRAGLSKGLFEGPVTMAHATVLHSFITGRLANELVSLPE